MQIVYQNDGPTQATQLIQLGEGFFKSEEYSITVHSARLCDLLIYTSTEIS